MKNNKIEYQNFLNTSKIKQHAMKINPKNMYHQALINTSQEIPEIECEANIPLIFLFKALIWVASAETAS